MFNVLIDELPTEYEGYLINYQYYNGILIDKCLKDKEGLFDDDNYGKLEKLGVALTILFGNGIPPIETAVNGLSWFLSCGNEDQKEVEDTNEYFCFDLDSQRIYSAFRVKYNINLATEKKLHWFEFIYLFNDLSKTAFREIVNIRMMNPSDYKGYSKEVKSEILRQKERFSLNKNIKKKYTEEENKLINEFYDKFVEVNNV